MSWLLLLPAFLGGAVVGYVARPRMQTWRLNQAARRRRKQLPKLRGKQPPIDINVHRSKGA